MLFLLRAQAQSLAFGHLLFPGLHYLIVLQATSPGAGALPEYNEAVVLVSTRLSEVRGFSDFFTGSPLRKA